MKQGAIFDQDGLLFDTERLFCQSWIAAGEQMGVEVPLDFCTAVSGSSGASMERIVRRYFREIDCKAYIKRTFQLCYELQNRHLTEKPGVHEILEFFRSEGVKLAVATSSHREQVERNLRKSGIWSYFEAVVTREDVSNGKPDPEIFLKAAEQIGVRPSECYVFEDSFNGIRAGNAGGFTAIMIPDLAEPTEAIRQISARVYPNLMTALDAIKQGRI